MSLPRPLRPEELRWRCDPATLPFECTDELQDLPGVLGQERAIEAIRFAISMRHEGYNLFVLGAVGTGRHVVTRSALEEQAATEPVPDDYVYVFGFARPEQPVALRLPPGRGTTLRKDMDRLVDDLRAALPKAFEASEVRARKLAVGDEIEERQRQILDTIRASARARGVAVVETETELRLVPARDGAPLAPEAIAALPDEERAELERRVGAMNDELVALLGQVPAWEREQRERLRALDREVCRRAIAPLFDELRARYADLPDVLTYLDLVAEDVVAETDRFLPPTEAPGEDGQAPPQEPDPFRRYRVNVLVDHAADRGAPVVYEDEPTLPALVGRVDHAVHQGALLTDFTLVRPGALHRANGGYLVLDARKVLQQPRVWELLKRALHAREVRVESLDPVANALGTVNLEPRPIPLVVKVVLIGEPLLYQLLSAHDPDFSRLFKVPAEFEDRMPRSEGRELLYCRMLATHARQSGLRPLHRAAAARVLEQASRLAGHVERLSTHVADLGDLLRAADHEAAAAGRARVEEVDVLAALAADERRRGSLRDRLLEALVEGELRVETQGAAVGQVNGLSVIEHGGLSFGWPARITARAWVGRGGVLDIERKARLGGPVHTKGVLILTGFLGERYARRQPLALSASLVFEQSYGEIEGDSATLAETAALLSAIAGLPARQDLAVTGSLDQPGHVQAVGGVNEKIEAFYALCAARGLTGTQGVIVPATNVRHLQLQDAVVEAVAAGRFHVWAAATVDEAVELLTGVQAGVRDTRGAWTPGSVNAAVQASLGELASLATGPRPPSGWSPEA